MLLEEHRIGINIFFMILPQGDKLTQKWPYVNLFWTLNGNILKTWCEDELNAAQKYLALLPKKESCSPWNFDLIPRFIGISLYDSGFSPHLSWARTLRRRISNGFPENFVLENYLYIWLDLINNFVQCWNIRSVLGVPSAIQFGIFFVLKPSGASKNDLYSSAAHISN